MFRPKVGQGKLTLTPGHKGSRVPPGPLLGLQEVGTFFKPSWGCGQPRWQLGIISQNSQANIHAHRSPAELPGSSPFYSVSFWPRGKHHRIAFMFHKQKANPTARCSQPHAQNVRRLIWFRRALCIFPSCSSPRWRSKRKFIVEVQTFLGPCPSSTLFFFAFLSAPHPHPTFPASPP